MTKTPVICVIDDDDLVRETICRALKDAGFETVDADNGVAGLKVIESSKARVAVIDIVMPTRAGHDVIVDASRKFPDLKILAVSGGGVEEAGEYLELALQLGAHDVLEKPFHSADLVKKIKKLA